MLLEGLHFSFQYLRVAPGAAWMPSYVVNSSVALQRNRMTQCGNFLQANAHFIRTIWCSLPFHLVRESPFPHLFFSTTSLVRRRISRSSGSPWQQGWEGHPGVVTLSFPGRLVCMLYLEQVVPNVVQQPWHLFSRLREQSSQEFRSGGASQWRRRSLTSFWPVNDAVGHWRLSNSWKSIQNTSKNLSKFVSAGVMASSASFWLRYCCHLHTDVRTRTLDKPLLKRAQQDSRTSS